MRLHSPLTERESDVLRAIGGLTADWLADGLDGLAGSRRFPPVLPVSSAVQPPPQ